MTTSQHRRHRHRLRLSRAIHHAEDLYAHRIAIEYVAREWNDDGNLCRDWAALPDGCGGFVVDVAAEKAPNSQGVSNLLAVSEPRVVEVNKFKVGILADLPEIDSKRRLLIYPREISYYEQMGDSQPQYIYTILGEPLRDGVGTLVFVEQRNVGGG